MRGTIDGGKRDEWRVVLRVNRTEDLSDPAMARSVASYLREKAREIERQSRPRRAEKWAKSIRFRLACAA